MINFLKFTQYDTHVAPPAMAIPPASFLFIKGFPLFGISGESNILPLLVIVIAVLYSNIRGANNSKVAIISKEKTQISK